MSTGTAHVWRGEEGGKLSLVPLSAVAQGDFVLGRVFDHPSWLMVVCKVTLPQKAPVMMHSVFGARFLSMYHCFVRLWSSWAVRSMTHSPRSSASPVTS